MKYIFVDESWEDYIYWQKTDKKKLKKINELLKDISRNRFEGLGKPEPLKHKYAGFGSRRIDSEHRLIYKYQKGEILIAKCRFHYDRKWSVDYNSMYVAKAIIYFLSLRLFLEYN